MYFFLLVGIPTGWTQVVERDTVDATDIYPNASIEIESVAAAIERFVGFLVEESDGTRKKIGLWPQKAAFKHGTLTQNSREDLELVTQLLRDHKSKFEVINQMKMSIWIEDVIKAIQDSVDTANTTPVDIQRKLGYKLTAWEELLDQENTTFKEFDCETWKIKCQLLELREEGVSSGETLNRLVKVIYCDHSMDYFLFIDLWGVGEEDDPQKLYLRVKDENLDVVRSNKGTSLEMSFIIRPPQKDTLSPLEKIQHEGDVHFANGEYRDALNQYETIVYRGVSDGEFNMKIGICCFYSNELGRAIVFFKKAIELGSDSVEPRGYLSWIYIKREEYGKAKEYLAELFEEYPKHDFTYRMWGLYAAAHQDHKVTFKHLKKAVKINHSVKDWIHTEPLLKSFRTTAYFERIKKMKRTDLRLKKSR